MSFNSTTDLPPLSAPRRKRSIWRRVNEVEDVAGQRMSVALSSAQLLELHTTPVEVVPAPGDGLVNVVTFFAVRYLTGETPYDTFADMGIIYPGMSARHVEAIEVGFDQAENRLAYGTNFAVSDPQTAVEDQPLQVKLSGQIVDGDGTAVVIVGYNTLVL